MQIRGTDFVAYEVNDFTHSVAFYRDTLGLKPLFIHDGKDYQWAEFDLCQTTLALYPPQKTEGRKAMTGGMLFIAVWDVGQAVEELKQKGVTITFGPIDTPVCEMAGFLDLEGNRIGLHHRKDGSVG